MTNEQIVSYYTDLRSKKLAAGLRPEQADEVIKRQRETDEANGLFGKVEKEAKAPVKTNDQPPANPPTPPTPPADAPPAGKGKKK